MATQVTSSSPDPIIRRTRSTSSPTRSSASTHTVDSSQKITLMEHVVAQDTWSANTQSDLLNIDEFKEKTACAKHWKDFKNGLKEYVAQVRSDSVAKKFEIEIKNIGR